MSETLDSLAPDSVIGILGGGQLGRMLALAAARLGLKTHIYAPSLDCPAGEVASYITAGDYEDTKSLTAFAKQCDAVTYEFENVPAVTAKLVGGLVPLRPNAKALDVAQDRLTEKTFLQDTVGVKVAGFYDVANEFDLKRALKRMGYPGVLKTRRFGYDGKGQAIIREESDIAAAWDKLGGQPLILEAFIPFVREVSVIAARGIDGTCKAYPLTENIHRNHILHQSLAPAAGDDGKAQEMAMNILTALDYVGVMGTEFFELQDGSLIVNEIAPRVHNSGHWTIEGSVTSQFQNHIRAICGLPLGDTRSIAPGMVMRNVVGKGANTAHEVLSDPDTQLHLYGKARALDGRKMGHTTTLTFD